MAVKPDMQMILVSNQEAIRHARQFLEALETTMLGAFVTPPQGSRWAMLMTELRDAEAATTAALTAVIQGARGK